MQPHPQQGGDSDLHSDVLIKDLALSGLSMGESKWLSCVASGKLLNVAEPLSLQS